MAGFEPCLRCGLRQRENGKPHCISCIKEAVLVAGGETEDVIRPCPVCRTDMRTMRNPPMLVCKNSECGAKFDPVTYRLSAPDMDPARIVGRNTRGANMVVKRDAKARLQAMAEAARLISLEEGRRMLGYAAIAGNVPEAASDDTLLVVVLESESVEAQERCFVRLVERGSRLQLSDIASSSSPFAARASSALRRL